jgi:hypothetical protein
MIKKKRFFLTALLVLGLTGLSLATVQQANPSGYHLLK